MRIVSSVVDSVSPMERSEFKDVKKQVAALSSFPRNYKVVISEATLQKAEAYKKQLEKDIELSGKYLYKALMEAKKSLKELSLEAFIEILVNTKKPTIFAESAVRGDGKDWNGPELSILGDINFVVPVTVFDNGVWEEPTIHDQPFEATLLFTPGALLRNDHRVITPDMKEVINNIDSKDQKAIRTINDDELYKLYERRLLPLLIEANNSVKMDGIGLINNVSEKVRETIKPLFPESLTRLIGFLAEGDKMKEAFITLPGLGCGQFAGEFRGQLAEKLRAALSKMLDTHKDKLTKIKGVYFDPFNECKDKAGVTKIGTIDFIVKPSAFCKDKKAQLCHPREYGEQYANCRLFSIVAWDHVSWPGNDFIGGSRWTDDGVKAAATSAGQVLTGIEGEYIKSQFQFNPKNKKYGTWEAAIVQNKLTLTVTGKLYVLKGDSLQAYKETVVSSSDTPIKIATIPSDKGKGSIPKMDAPLGSRLPIDKDKSSISEKDSSLESKGESKGEKDFLKILKKEINAIIGKYTHPLKISWFGHNCSERAAAVKTAIQNAESKEVIRNILQNQRELYDEYIAIKNGKGATLPTKLPLSHVPLDIKWSAKLGYEPKLVRKSDGLTTESGFYTAIKSAQAKYRELVGDKDLKSTMTASQL